MTSSTSVLWKDFLLVVLSGFLLMFSWHNMFNSGIAFWPGVLAFFALIPFIHVWRRTGWRGTFIFGWIMGFIYFMGILFWMQYINADSRLDNRIAWVFFSFCGGLYFALYSSTATLVKAKLKWADTLVLGIGWVAWEYLRGHIITGGWPWGSLGHTQYANPVTRQLASVVGVGGLSFVIVAINVAVLNFANKIVRKDNIIPKIDTIIVKIKENYKKRPINTAINVVFVILWMFLITINIVEMIQFKNAPKAEIKVALIQGNISTNQSWDEAYKEKVLNKMEKLHQQAVTEKPYLIIWAESCFPGILEFEPYKKWEEKLKIIIKAGKIPTLLTSNEYVPTRNLVGQEYRHYNSVFLLNKNAEVAGKYRKIKLVPLGEYIPWNWLRLIVDPVVREPIPIDFEPGKSYQPLNIGRLRFSPLVCYEDHFEELGYQLAKRDSHFFVAVANNGWSGEATMGLQHTTMSVFLAVEHRMAIAKADMTGPTCIIDGWGNMSSSLPYFKEGVKTGIVKVANIDTFFTRFGNIIPFGFTLLFFLLIIISTFQVIKPTK